MDTVLFHGNSPIELLIASCLPRLLNLYWVSAAASVIVTALPVPVPQAFKDAVYLSACRGKLWSSKPAALGPLQDWSVPQAWFLHFYLVGACCNAAVLTACVLSNTLGRLTSQTLQPLLGLSLFQLHLVRRILETRFLLHYPAGAVMHGIAYVFGLSYYLVVPLSLLPAGWFQQQQWRHLSPWSAAVHGSSIKDVLGSATTLQLLGTGVFLTGNVLQFLSHRSLAALSKSRQEDSKKNAYKIPRGGLFDYVSCPHYLAEIIIYCGLCMVTRWQLQPLLMLLWVVVNLVLAADATHKWYRSHFKAYPAARKAIVPFVY